MLATVILLFTLTFAYLAFGHRLLRFLPLQFTPLEKLLLAAVLSIAVVSSCIALFGQVISTLSFLVLIPAVAVGIYERKELWKTVQAAVPSSRLDWGVLCLGAIAVISVGSTQFLSGSSQPEGIVYQDVHDSMWHVSLGKAILQSLPPAHPADSSLTLTQYHYFFDVFLASLSYLSNLSLLTLTYQVSPILVLILLFSAAYVLGARLTHKLGGLTLLALTAWAGSFAYMIPWFLADHTWGESSFWVSQTFAMLVNPQVLFSFACVYIFLLLQLKPFRGTVARHAILIPLLATSIGFKSYGWVVLSLVYAVDLLWELVTTKQLKFVGIGLLYLLVSAPFLWLITRFAADSTFFYQPLWFIDTMVEAPDRLNHIQWKFLEDHYRLKANWPRVIEIKTKEIAVFYFGNLGIRSLFFFALPLIAFWKKAHFTHWKVVTLSLVGFLFASIFPLLFLQVGVVWNSIQFWYYALIFANVLLLVSFAPLLAKRHWIAQLLVISLLVAGTVPAFIRTTQHKLTSRVTLTHQQRELLGQLSERDVVLVCPEDTLLFKTTIVQALTPARALVSDPVQLELVGADTTLLKEIESLFSRKEAGSLVEFLDEHDVRKVLCSTSDLQKFITTELEVGEAAKMQAADNWQLFSR